MASLVLMYHRIAKREEDPFHLCVSPSNFDAHLETLGRLADVLPLRDLVRSRSFRGHRATVTFDDGYLDNLGSALPLIVKHATPATFFISCKAVLHGVPFWWDEFQRTITHGSTSRKTVPLRLGRRRIEMDMSSTVARKTSFWKAYPLLREGSPQEVQRCLSDLRERIVDPGADPLDRPLNPAELKKLAGSPLATIGAHGMSHSVLANLRRSEQRFEISRSRSELETFLSAPVREFAYPFGGAGSFTRRTEKILHREGFELACTTIPGRFKRRPSKLRVPRMMVHDWTGPEFEDRLRAWLTSSANEPA
jgi:peptidoglycan/xylan/chitin deacetylase (PgdA/CDA1 family)